MRDYEIRLLTERFTPSLTIQTRHANDRAAIMTARRMCDGKPFEVWRDLECIHGARDTQVVPLFPNRPAA